VSVEVILLLGPLFPRGDRRLLVGTPTTPSSFFWLGGWTVEKGAVAVGSKDGRPGYNDAKTLA